MRAMLLGRPIDATFIRRDDSGVVELASASGLSRLSPDERDALAASTFGTGQVLAAAIGLRVRKIVLGLGGSATTDGGAGLLTALGARFFDERGQDLAYGGGALGNLARVDLDEVSPILAEVQLTIASDVRNPLLGASGAAATYGPQKGANPAQVATLDANLSRYADLLEEAAGRTDSRCPRCRRSGRHHGRPAGHRRPFCLVRDQAGCGSGDGADRVRLGARVV